MVRNAGIQAKLSAAGAISVKRGASPSYWQPHHSVTLAQFDPARCHAADAGLGQIEELVGISSTRRCRLTVAAQLDVAASQIKDYLAQASYYK